MVMPEALEKLLTPIEGGEVAERMRGTFRPSPMIPMDESLKREEQASLNKDDELAKAFAIVKSYMDRGHSFTNFQTDLGARLIMTKLPSNKVNWIREISDKIHKRPLWQCFAGWFAFADENSMAQAPVFDVAWDNKVDFDPEATICPECNRSFVPGIFGQIFCGNACGAKTDKRRIDELTAKQSHPGPIA